jgi:curli biogenesis system outer membrane secretion channel CsgG
MRTTLTPIPSPVGRGAHNPELFASLTLPIRRLIKSAGTLSLRERGDRPVPGRWVRVALLPLLFTACQTPQIAVNQRADFSKIHRVAVATFAGPGGSVAADLLTQDLLRHGADVVERQRLDELLREQQMGADKTLDSNTVKKIGHVLGVDAIFMGTVGSNIPSQSYLVTSPPNNIYGSVTPLGGNDVYTATPAWGVPDSQVVTSAAQAALIARMVDVETGSVLWSGRMTYEGYDNQSAMASITGSFARSLIPIWPALHP